MKIAILGMGGVGATVGGALAAWAEDLVFIARGETKNVLQEKGLLFESEVMGTRTVRPALVSDNPKEIGVVDVLFVCSKSYGLQAACETYREIVGEDTLVIPLLNGVSAPREIASHFQNKGQIAHGYIYCLSNIVETGKIINFGKLLRMGFGFPDGKKNEKGERLATMLTEGGLPAVFTAEILGAVWDKYAMMCGNSCAFIYYNCEAGPIQKDPEKMAFLRQVYEDIKRLAMAAGAKVAPDMPEKYEKEFATLPPQTTSSLYRDIRDGKKDTEFEFLVGNGCRLAKELGVEVPFMQEVYINR